MRLYILISLFVLTACNGNSTKSSPIPKSSEDISRFEGIYQDTVKRGEFIDEAYIVISSGGLANRYDYKGDSFNNGANCFTKEFLFRIMNHQGGDAYYLTGPAVNGLSYNIYVSGNAFAIDTQDGQIKYPRTNLLISDIEPSC